MRHNVITIVTAITAAALAAGAAAFEAPRLPGPATADREVSATHALPAVPGGPRTFRIELAFEATPSNNVQACLGRAAAPAGMAAPRRLGHPARHRARRVRAAGAHHRHVRPGRHTDHHQMTEGTRT